MWACFWAFYPVPLIYGSVFVLVLYCFDDPSFVVQSEFREHESSSFVVLSQDCFVYSGSFLSVQFFFFLICSSSAKNILGIGLRDDIESSACHG